jgi:hypothetical protein
MQSKVLAIKLVMYGLISLEVCYRAVAQFKRLIKSGKILNHLLLTKILSWLQNWPSTVSLLGTILIYINSC